MMRQVLAGATRVTAAAAVIVSAAGLGTTPAAATRIHTGGETGAYHRDFCPPVARELTTGGTPYTCTTSSGTRENMERVRANPREIGFGQLDVFTLEMNTTAANNTLQIIRQDDARECVFAVTRNRNVNSYGELAAYAASMRFFLPPQGSGSASTFQFLRSVDRNGLGRADTRTVTNVQGGTDDAIRAALNRDDGIAFFVQFPDPDNERFKLVRDLGGHFVPVIDRSILNQEINGRSVYFAQDTRIQNSRVMEMGGRVSTACTPIVMFTGDPARIRDQSERRQHQELIQSLKSLSTDVILPRQSPLRTALQRTRELSAEGRERFLAYSHRARDRALPFIERMIERAAPRIDTSSRSDDRRTDNRD